jgi:hypothetical protein
MSLVKTQATLDDAQEVLHDSDFLNPSNLMALSGGELSQAFSFDVADQGYILRFNTKEDGFLKDQIVFEMLGNQIHIPEILSIKKRGDLYCCFSKRCPGILFEDHSLEEQVALLPNMMSSLKRIHSHDISNTSGFGWWYSEDRDGKFSSWKLSLDARVNHFNTNDYIAKTI